MNAATTTAPSVIAAKANRLARRLERARERYTRIRDRKDRACDNADAFLEKEASHKVHERWEARYGRYHKAVMRAEKALARHIVKVTGVPVPDGNDDVDD
jgi:hypothetical protein